MDNLTHGLLGAAIGMLRRRDAGAETDFPLHPPSHTDRAVVWSSFLAAELPDLDVFLGSGEMGGYIYHRGLTHSLVFAPVVAAIATALTKLVWRKAQARTVFLWSLTSVLIGHLVNDWFTGWGTRLLLPFSEARLGLDWVPIVDLLYTVPLLAAIVLAWRRPSLRRRAVMGVLGYLLVYTVGYRGTAHALVEAGTRQAYTGRPVQQMRVAPDLLNPLRWQVTVDLGDRYEQGWAYPFGGFQLEDVFVKSPDDNVIRAVREAPELKPFFDQFAYVRIQYQKVGPGYEVTMDDVRYQFRGRGMGLRVLVSPDLQISQIFSAR